MYCFRTLTIDIVGARVLDIACTERLYYLCLKATLDFFNHRHRLIVMKIAWRDIHRTYS